MRRSFGKQKVVKKFDMSTSIGKNKTWQRNKKNILLLKMENGKIKKSSKFIKSFLYLIAISLILSSFLLSAPQKTTIKEILDNPDTYNQKEVIVVGEVINFKPTISKKGNPYTTFSLIDDDYNALKVFIWGHQEIKNKDIKNNDKVEVIGIFKKIKYVGKYRFYNEIEAENIKKRR